MSPRLSRAERKKRARRSVCPLCHEKQEFLWICPCGFAICARCMEQEAWGMTCNNITWVCPDCGEVRSF